MHFGICKMICYANMNIKVIICVLWKQHFLLDNFFFTGLQRGNTILKEYIKCLVNPYLFGTWMIFEISENKTHCGFTNKISIWSKLWIFL